MTLWTPGGEREIKKTADPNPPSDAQEMPELTPEQRQQAEEMAKQLTEAREQILGTGVNEILANHAMGIYELAAIHLTADEPNLEETKLAIDALGHLIEGLDGRLGENEATLKEALHQIRLGFVARSKDMAQAADSTEGPRDE
jgi:uncharacterized protein with GYD domain